MLSLVSNGRRARIDSCLVFAPPDGRSIRQHIRNRQQNGTQGPQVAETLTVDVLLWKWFLPTATSSDDDGDNNNNNTIGEHHESQASKEDKEFVFIDYRNDSSNP